MAQGTNNKKDSAGLLRISQAFSAYYVLNMCFLLNMCYNSKSHMVRRRGLAFHLIWCYDLQSLPVKLSLVY